MHLGRRSVPVLLAAALAPWGAPAGAQDKPPLRILARGEKPIRATGVVLD